MINEKVKDEILICTEIADKLVRMGYDEIYKSSKVSEGEKASTNVMMHCILFATIMLASFECLTDKSMKLEDYKKHCFNGIEAFLEMIRGENK